ncbi:MAG: hypothetical protein ACOC1K_00500 [Nanoarchaeota archaeon]
MANYNYFYIFLINENRSKYYSDITIPSTVKVTNTTDYKLDTIIGVLSSHIFEYDTLSVKVYYMSINILYEDFHFKAFIQKNPFYDKEYFIFISRGLSDNELKKSLSHEFVHIDQMERGDLIISGLKAYWKGEEIDLNNVHYMDRGFEIEAHNKQKEVLRKLNKILYR